MRRVSPATAGWEDKKHDLKETLREYFTERGNASCGVWKMEKNFGIIKWTLFYYDDPVLTCMDDGGKMLLERHKRQYTGEPSFYDDDYRDICRIISRASGVNYELEDLGKYSPKDFEYMKPKAPEREKFRFKQKKELKSAVTEFFTRGVGSTAAGPWKLSRGAGLLEWAVFYENVSVIYCIRDGGDGVPCLMNSDGKYALTQSDFKKICRIIQGCCGRKFAAEYQ